MPYRPYVYSFLQTLQLRDGFLAYAISCGRTHTLYILYMYIVYVKYTNHHILRMTSGNRMPQLLRAYSLDRVIIVRRWSKYDHVGRITDTTFRRVAMDKKVAFAYNRFLF